MNIGCEDGEHLLGSNVSVDVVASQPRSVTHRDASDARAIALDDIVASVEAHLPAWIREISPFVDNTAQIILLPNQPTHVRQVWWPQGSTYEGHPTHALEQIAVRVVDGIAFDRDDVAVPAPRAGAQCRLVPIAQESP